MKSILGVFFTALCLFVTLPNAQATPVYSLTSIDNNLLNSASSGPVINDLGQIAYGNGVRETAGSWSYLQPLGSPDPGPGYAMAAGINNLGQVVGASSTTGYYSAATIWNGGIPTGIDDGDARGSAATDINDSGQIVGYGNNLGYGWPIFEGVPIGDYLSYGQAAAYGINDLGIAVGSAIPHEQISASQAVMWSSAGMTNLDTRVITDPDGNIVAYWGSVANDINNAGQIIGQAAYESGMHATLWENGNMLDLGTLNGVWGSNAYAINESGIAIGDSDNRAVSFQKGQILDLNTLIDPAILQAGWLLTSATDINENGWIVGNMFNQQSGDSEIFLLKPISQVPEPAPWTMLLLGAGVAVYAGRHRKSG